MNDSAIPSPQDWSYATLQDVAEINPKLDKSCYSDDLVVSFVPMPAVEPETGSIDISGSRQFAMVKKGYTVFREEDILFAKITPCMENGKMAVVPALINDLGFGSTEFHVLRSYVGIIPEYIYYFISSLQFRYDAEHNMTGAVGQRRVPASYLSNHLIPIPPTHAQRRIINKIEHFFSELDKGIENLKKAREQLKVYRQAVLKHAFEGKLTEQWRKDNADKLETADQLLTRIQKEREERYQQQLNDWKKAVKKWEAVGKKGKKPVKPKALESFKVISLDECSNLPELPHGWVWTKFENLIEYVTSGSRGWAKYYSESGAQFIRAQNVKYDSLNLSDIAYVKLPKDVEGKRTLIKKSDLLITITGANVTKTAYVKDEIGEAYVSQHVALCRLVKNRLDNYLYMFLIAGTLGRKQLEKLAYGAGKPGLNLDNIKNVLVPIASIYECKKVAEQLEEKNSIIEQLDCELGEQIHRAETLRQSIVKKAFSGQLVEQNPNDEPASVLLERIKAEKEKQIKSSPKKKRTSKRKNTA